MKNKIWLFLVICVTFLINSCEEDEFIFKSEDSFVAFEVESAEIQENNTEYKILVTLAAYKGSPVTVNFDFADSIGTSQNLAIEGVDFELINPSKTLTFENGVGVDTITIRTIDNDLTDGTRNIWLVLTSNSANYNIGLGDGSKAGVYISIFDDEHPLKYFAGSYTHVGNSIWTGTQTWTTTVSTNPEDDSQLFFNVLFRWWWDVAIDVVATVDETNHTITFAAGEKLIDRGDLNNYLTIYDFENLETQWQGDPIEGKDIVGTYTVNSDKTEIVITLPSWGGKWMLPDGSFNARWVEDYFTTSTLTKN